MKYKKNIILLFSIYVIGILFGFILYILLDENSKLQIFDNINQVVSLTTKDNFNSINILKNGLQTNSIFVILIILSSFMIISFAVISFAIFLKGTSLSLYICIIFKVFGFWKGILGMVTMAVIPSIIITFCYIFLGNECYNSNLKLLMRISKNTIFKSIFSNTIKALMIIPFVILSIYLEQIFFRIIVSM